jgi:methionyl-tRNA synthetase
VFYSSRSHIISHGRTCWRNEKQLAISIWKALAHIGAAVHYAQIDMIARTARMTGKNVLFTIGIDRNGLPVEMYTEKKHNIRMHAIVSEK